MYENKTGNVFTVVRVLAEKWFSRLNEEIIVNMIKQSFTVLYSTYECTYARYVNYQIVHDSVATKRGLELLGIKSDESCRCCAIKETLLHALTICPEIACVWFVVSVILLY